MHPHASLDRLVVLTVEFSGDNLVEYFPDLSRDDLPVQAIMMHMTPDESAYWIAGQRGDIFKVGTWWHEMCPFSDP